MPCSKVQLRDLVRTGRQMRRVLEASGRAVSRPADLVCRPVLVGTSVGTGERGCLVFSQGRLVAVLVRVGGGAHQHDGIEPLAAGWFLEAGFGPCAADCSPPLSGTLREALAWVRRRLALDVAGTATALRATFDYAGWLHQDTGRMLAEARAALADAEQLLAEVGGRPDLLP